MTARRGKPSAVEERINLLQAAARAEPGCLDDPQFLAEAAGAMEELCKGDKEAARLMMTRMVLSLRQQRDQLVAALNAVKDQKPTLGWVTSKAYVEQDSSLRERKYVYVMPVADRPAPPELFEIIPPTAGDDGSVWGSEWDDSRERFPFLAIVDAQSKVFLRPADHLPPPPMRAELLRAITAGAQGGSDQLGEVEVLEGPDRKFTMLSDRELALEIDRIIQEGESVTVRVEGGVVKGIHHSDRAANEPWLTFPDLEGPVLNDLIFPYWLHKQWERDIRHMLRGRPLRINLIGPTGVGKTAGVVYAARQAARELVAAGKCKGLALITISSSTVGSSFIHETEINMRQAVRKATSLHKKGYLAVILCDEADALLGEMANMAEHSHNKTERLTFQELLTNNIEGATIYLTMNPRRTSYLPAAIETRFRRRVYPRSTRSQMAMVASSYVSDKTLKTLGMTRNEFGGVVADNLYSDDRVVARAHFMSGREVVVRARDTLNASPAKIKALLEIFNYDVEDGEADGIEDLWEMIDREFQIQLNPQNLWELTFLQAPSDDALRTVELVR